MLNSDRLKRLRARVHITQQELAQRSGLSIGLIFQLEQGKKANPRLDTLVKLANALHSTVAELIGETPIATEPQAHTPMPPDEAIELFKANARVGGGKKREK